MVKQSQHSLSPHLEAPMEHVTPATSVIQITATRYSVRRASSQSTGTFRCNTLRMSEVKLRYFPFDFVLMASRTERGRGGGRGGVPLASSSEVEMGEPGGPARGGEPRRGEGDKADAG